MTSICFASVALGMLKAADHVNDRRIERTTLSELDIEALRTHLNSAPVQGILDRNKTYHYHWPGRGYGVIGAVGKKRPKHVLKTILGPGMQPPGTVLPSTLAARQDGDAEKIPEGSSAA